MGEVVHVRGQRMFDMLEWLLGVAEEGGNVGVVDVAVVSVWTGVWWFAICYLCVYIACCNIGHIAVCVVACCNIAQYSCG